MEPTATPTSEPPENLCFSSHNTVIVEGKGKVSIDKLKVGDLVVTSHKGDLSRVYSLAHNDPNGQTEYLQISTDTGDTIEISGSHMLFVNNKLTLAKDVVVGNFLGDSQKVVEIGTITRRGMYAPLTENGEILVSGVRSSSYVGILKTSLSMQAFVYHAGLAPLRIVCGFHFGFCKAESYSVNGYASHIAYLIKPAQQIYTYPPIIQMMVLVLVLPIVVFFLLLEYALAIWPIALVVVSLVLRAQNKVSFTNASKKTV